MRRRAFTFALAALLLCGCGAKKELPEDQPYNHGLYGYGDGAIMESEDGYYTNHIPGNGNHLALRFYERDTENQIFLCAKPECIHGGGESCTATYKDLECPESILYDGAIYNLTVEMGDTVSVSLYKAALDGTSLTKVGDAFTVSNSAGEEEVEYISSFIVHRGYAYISYRVTLGEGTFGFAGSGLVKMDISNGKTEQLWSGENYFSGYPQQICGSGDYVYYSNITDNDECGFYRYDTESGELEKFWNMYPTVGERKFFVTGYDDETMTTTAIFSCGKEKADIERASQEGLDLVAGGFEKEIAGVISYEDKVIAVFENGTEYQIFSEEGEKLGEMTYDDEDGLFWGCVFTVSNGKIYLTDSVNYVERDGKLYPGEYSDIIYSCSIDDIINGKGEWKFEYGIKDIMQIEGWEIRDYYANDRN